MGKIKVTENCNGIEGIFFLYEKKSEEKEENRRSK